MATRSGIVLNAVTHVGIGGVSVYTMSPLTSGAIDMQYSEPNGYFEVTVPSTTGIIYAPFASGYIGYSALFTSEVSPVLLYMQPNNYIPNSSGTSNIVLQNKAHTTSYNIRDVQHSPTELYCITEAGLDIINLETLQNVGYITYTGGFTAIYVNPKYTVRSGVLLGTSNSGILEFNIPTSGYNVAARNLNSLLKTKYTVQSVGLTADNVCCIAKSELGGIVIGTISGVDCFTSSGTHYKSNFTSDLGVTACCISDFGDVYYSPTNSGLYVKYGPISSNWTAPDYIISISGYGDNPFPLLTGYINDIKITSVSGANTVILSTVSGLLVYDENRADLNVSASGCKLLRNYP